MHAMTGTASPLVIALDGPAASGKGTLARALAAHYGFAHLDTGILYRGVAWLLIEAGFSPDDAARAAEIAEGFELYKIDGAPIRSREVGAAASVVAANPDVRKALFDFQRRFAFSPPGGVGGAVLDGRDIGTVVCPEACVKFFVTASPEVRAHRRWRELEEAGKPALKAEILADIRERDARDAGRKDAPMTKAADAELLDTSSMTIEGAFAAARRIIDDVFKRCAS